MTLAFDLFYWLVEWSWWPESAHGYAFFSSVGGTFLFSAGIFTYLHKHNCHEHRCWRIGRVQLADGTLTCHKHDPRHEDSHKEEGHVKRMWGQHLERHGIHPQH